MEKTSVIIVGAGPSGLVLGLSLANHKVKSIILERDAEITEDPRGVYLAGDSVRVLWSLGIQDELSKIGHEQGDFMGHKGSITNPAFHRAGMKGDWRHQVVPDGIMQVQAELERALQQKIESSSYCQLRRGCDVFSCEETEQGMTVQYRSHDGIATSLTGSWLVGADGKRGYVRKHYLEPVAGIRQETGVFKYEATWIAANLQIKLPTSETHPELPFWQMGITPEDVYDLYWPEHIHFVCPPGKPTATMRFGPVEARLWRHEFAEPCWDDSHDAEALLWEHLLPMVTRDDDGKGRPFQATTFPRDCIKIRRCRAHVFSQKVVNKWFHKRTILIGDAAHVFPPFAGQGITSGIRDAHALAWRIALFDSLSDSLQESAIDDMLTAWSSERKQAIDDSARLTQLNGQIVHGETVLQSILRTCFSLIQRLPMMPVMQTGLQSAEEEAYRGVKGGFFRSGSNGGRKAAQVYVQKHGQKPILSDELLRHDTSLMSLIILDDTDRREVEAILDQAILPQIILSNKSIIRVGSSKTQPSSTVFRTCSSKDLSHMKLRKGYDDAVYQDRFGKDVKYVIMRPDFIVYSASKSLSELEHDLHSLKVWLRL